MCDQLLADPTCPESYNDIIKSGPKEFLAHDAKVMRGELFYLFMDLRH